MHEQCWEETHQLGRLKLRPEAALRLYWIAMRLTSNSLFALLWLLRVPTDRVMTVITNAPPLIFGTYPSDSLQPGFGLVDPTSHSASHSGPSPWPLADTMVRVPHGSWRDDAARVVRSSLMSTEVSLATSLYATWSALTSQPITQADFPKHFWLTTYNLLIIYISYLWFTYDLHFLLMIYVRLT